MYYLDTNAVIELANKFDVLANSCSNITTSYLAVLELIANIKNQDSFCRRKSVLSKLKSSAVKIEWTCPQNKFLDSFSTLGKNYTDESTVRLLFNLLLMSETYDEFELLVDESDNPNALDNVRGYDTAISNFGVQFSYEATQELKKSLSKGEFKYLRDQLYKDDMISEYTKRNAYNNLKTYLTSFFNCNETNNSQKYHSLLHAYDRSVDTFFIAEAYLTLESKFDKRIYKRNDFVDLYHLLYIKNDDVIITNDKLLLGLANKTNSFVALTPSDFLKKTCI